VGWEPRGCAFPVPLGSVPDGRVWKTTASYNSSVLVHVPGRG
jgi:hypothetical protein